MNQTTNKSKRKRIIILSVFLAIILVLIGIIAGKKIFDSYEDKILLQNLQAEFNDSPRAKTVLPISHKKN